MVNYILHTQHVKYKSSLKYRVGYRVPMWVLAKIMTRRRHPFGAQKFIGDFRGFIFCWHPHGNTINWTFEHYDVDGHPSWHIFALHCWLYNFKDTNVSWNNSPINLINI